MSNNYHEMTLHKKRKAKTKVSVYAVPEIGYRMSLDLAFVCQDETEGGKLGTPMTKIRLDSATGTWHLVPRHEAGMFVFFNSEPGPEHKELVITHIIPSNTGCYADPV